MRKITVIIPAAGKATRMRPLSSGTSKCMVAVNGRPIISYILDRLMADDRMDDVVIVTNTLGDVEAFVQWTYPKEWQAGRIRCVVQDDPKGPLHAVNIGWEATPYYDPHRTPGVANVRRGVLVWLGDTICQDDCLDFTSDFLVTSPIITEKWRWCLVDAECNFYDKPDTDVPADQALIGLYYFEDIEDFSVAIMRGICQPTHKGEHQIAALLEEHIRRNGCFRLHTTRDWYDCGELNTYYDSRARLMQGTSRSFNRLQVDTFLGTVTKWSWDEKAGRKIEREKEWFLSLTGLQQLFVPRVLDSPPGTLKMSWEAGTPLNEMWLYERMKPESWIQVLDKLYSVYHSVFVDRLATNWEAVDDADAMYVTGPKDRIFGKMLDFPDFDRVMEFVVRVGSEAMDSIRWSGIIHGDLHLGNILFDPFTGGLKLLDPRGHFGHRDGTAGDTQYDMAKSLQCTYGGYSNILGKRVSPEGRIAWPDGRERIVEWQVGELARRGYNVRLLLEMSVVLLVTCIPFHADDPIRQARLWERAQALIADPTDGGTVKIPTH